MITTKTFTPENGGEGFVIMGIAGGNSVRQ